MSNVSRRSMLRGTAGAVAGAALVVAPSAWAATGPGNMDHTGHDGHGMGHGPAPFDEVYQGRHITGRPAEGRHAMHGGYAVTIDGKELHVMQNADGTWISVVSHYQPMPDPHAVTRAAVDKLHGATLVPIAA